MNSVQLIGRTTRDIDLRYTAQTQTAVGTFTLAVNRMRKEDGADFIHCKVWGKRAEVMEQFIKKGNMVAVSGRIETGSYTNKDGQTVYTTEVVVDSFDFIEPRRQTEQTEQTDEPPITATDGEHQEEYAYLDDDLPF